MPRVRFSRTYVSALDSELDEYFCIRLATPNDMQPIISSQPLLLDLYREINNRESVERLLLIVMIKNGQLIKFNSFRDEINLMVRTLS